MRFYRMLPESHSFGLNEDELTEIINVLKAFPEVEQAWIFGSRALKTYKRGSDIDIAIFGSHLDLIITAISYRCNEELLLPYFFDIVDYNGITNKELKEHIDRVGIPFYKNSQGPL